MLPRPAASFAVALSAALAAALMTAQAAPPAADATDRSPAHVSLDTDAAVRKAVRATAREAELESPGTRAGAAAGPTFGAPGPGVLPLLGAAALRIGCSASSRCAEEAMPAASCRVARARSLAVAPGACPLRSD